MTLSLALLGTHVLPGIAIVIALSGLVSAIPAAEPGEDACKESAR